MFKKGISMNKRRIILFSALMVLMAVSTYAAAWNLTGNLGCHDPALTREGNNWYVFYTGTGIRRKTSTNGLYWSEAAPVFSSGLSWWKTHVPGNPGNDVWAPDIGYFNGRWWLYYSISTFGSNTSCIGLASCASGIGGNNWRDDGLVIRSTSANSYNCIDPNLFIDPSGNPWLAFGSFWNGIHLTRLDPATMKPTGSLYNIARRSGGIEAPFIIYHGGYYYLFVSIDKCCSGTSSTYKIAYGRSTSVTGPYLDQNGVNMLNGGGTVLLSTSGNIIGPGGQSIFNNNALCYHYYDGNANGAPRLRISDLYFVNGWPSLTGGPVTTPTPTPTPTPSVLATPTSTATPTPGGPPYQAELASYGGGAVTESTNGGYNGSGYINFPSSGGYLQFNNVNGGQGGNVTLRLRYALGVSGSRTGRIQVNGGAWQNITFNPTGSWTTWTVKEVGTILNSGPTNTIRLESTGQDLANIDELDVTVSSVTPAVTPTASVINTPTATPTVSIVVTPTNTPTASIIATPTNTPTASATPTPTRSPAGGYVVEYVNQNDWGSGATINLIITNNTSSAVSAWTLAFTFPGNQQINHMWGGTYTQNGAEVTVRPVDYTNTIGEGGGSVILGFNISYSGTNGEPASFTLNGIACQVR